MLLEHPIVGTTTVSMTTIPKPSSRVMDGLYEPVWTHDDPVAK